MTARDAIIARLLADPAVASAVADRITPHWAPQGVEPPYIVVSQISATRPHHMGGPSGLVEARVQVDVFAEARAACEALASDVRRALDGYRGAVSAGASTLILQQCHLDNELYELESWDEYAEAPALARVTQDYLIAHHESV
ncbi:MAG TPA: DUF3168 domain-containing protein [Arachnia sp.]|nr:DUF3168 domain-containing protein [Arachnia sp.]